MEEAPRRRGHLWEMVDYQRMMEAFRDGQDDEDVALEPGRSRASIKSRCRYLMEDIGGPASRMTGREAQNTLREMFADDPEWDWTQHVKDVHERKGPHLWDEAADALLTRAWERETPRLPDIARQFRASETEVAQRLIRVGVAQHFYEVVERLGCTPGEPLEVNARVARANAEALVWALVITRGTETEHLSLHATEAEAQQARDDLPVDDEPPLLTRRWTIAARMVGEGNIRSATSGDFTD